jgi:NitT/TauT family transport system substrate-binding protein
MKRFILVLAVLVLAATAVSAQDETIRFQASSPHGFIYSGFYMAAANGYYEDEGLNVELLGGGFNAERVWVDSIEQVVTGEAEFGVTSLSQLLEARAAGKPIVGIATVMQRSPLAILSLPESGITKPEDLLDKTLTISGGPLLSFEALMSGLQLDTSAITYKEREQDSLQQLIDGQIDGFGAWLIIDGVTLEEAGLNPNYVVFSDYGIDTYDVMLFTREDMIAEKPDAVERFVRSTLKGYDVLIDDPETAAEVTVSYNPEGLVYEQQFNRINAFLPLVKPANSDVGMMTEDVFEYNHDLLLDAGVLTEPLEDLTTAYNLTFLNAIYGEQS